jgi:hypothetical protein
LAVFSLYYAPSANDIRTIPELHSPVCIGQSDSSGNFFFHSGEMLNEVGQKVISLSQQDSFILKSHLDFPSGILPHRLQGQLMIQLHPWVSITNNDSVANLILHGWNVFQTSDGCGAWRYAC